MKLSVVILNYNVRYFLELCLRSVTAAISEIESEIIVVDNHSKDDSCEMVRELFPKVILIENDENVGFSIGNNQGVAKAIGEYVCILNPDTVLAEDCFSKLLSFMDSIKDVGIVGCHLIDGRGKFLPESKRNVPTPLVSVQKIFGNSNPYYANQLSEYEIGKVSILVGAFMLLKRSVYNEVNGFDEDFFMYGEDMDFSYRILKAGYHNYYNPTTTVIHFKGESTLKDKIYAKRFNSSMQLFFKKHFKLNGLYNAVIWLGVQAIILINHQPKSKTINVNGYVLTSDVIPDGLQRELHHPIELYAGSMDGLEFQQIIFDSNSWSFKSIIEHLKNWQTNETLTYKFLPLGAKFIVGSNDSKNKGEILQF